MSNSLSNALATAIRGKNAPPAIDPAIVQAVAALLLPQLLAALETQTADVEPAVPVTPAMVEQITEVGRVSSALADIVRGTITFDRERVEDGFTIFETVAMIPANSAPTTANGNGLINRLMGYPVQHRKSPLRDQGLDGLHPSIIGIAREAGVKVSDAFDSYNGARHLPANERKRVLIDFVLPYLVGENKVINGRAATILPLGVAEGAIFAHGKMDPAARALIPRTPEWLEVKHQNSIRLSDELNRLYQNVQNARNQPQRTQALEKQRSFILEHECCGDGYSPLSYCDYHLIIRGPGNQPRLTKSGKAFLVGSDLTTAKKVKARKDYKAKLRARGVPNGVL